MNRELNELSKQADIVIDSYENEKLHTIWTVREEVENQITYKHFDETLSATAMLRRILGGHE